LKYEPSPEVTARFVASDAAEAEMFPTIGRSSSLSPGCYST
jgi:hypothetical protein